MNPKAELVKAKEALIYRHNRIIELEAENTSSVHAIARQVERIAELEISLNEVMDMNKKMREQVETHRQELGEAHVEIERLKRELDSVRGHL